jgi:D-alanyl-D-alanine carboxypeptidase
VVFDQLQLGNISLDDEHVISVNAWREGTYEVSLTTKGLKGFVP